MRALVVVNPAATATTAKTRDVLLRALGSELKVDLAETTHRGHARELGARAVEDGVDVVVTLGGDGTVNEVVNGLLAGGPSPDLPALAVVPGGSTNVFARALGRSRDPVEATAEVLESLRAERIRSVGLGTASIRRPGTATWTAPRWFVFAAGLGFDAEVIERVELRRAQGRRSTGALYVRQATAAFLVGAERRHPAMTLHLPGEEPVEKLFLCLFSNVSPWTYLGARPIPPQPRGELRDRHRRVRDGPPGAAADAGHGPPDARPRAGPARAGAAPPARPAGCHRRGGATAGLAAGRRPPGHRRRAARRRGPRGPARRRLAARRRGVTGRAGRHLRQHPRPACRYEWGGH